MPSIEYRPDRPKAWRAIYWGPDGKRHSRSFAREYDAKRWLTSEEAAKLQGTWADPNQGTPTLQRLGRRVVGGLVL